ncbi:glycoside hydrolase family 13 protein [Rhizoctonia solani AG-3 Rhs1AP]|uniref:Glycoside hydrolase family 13 protein n=2 Tax=Rhizoctonia solani AG-3 TaxID=1086053 RepID=A0A074RY02_9AGAM|nr:glycoside hydrolase family 13 protein [Rhizoctonia solani AG-3 Rhs1AP]KEP49513.1 glycoside hydrolase family 13 protein [Rhizoctonia solani 123E]
MAHHANALYSIKTTKDKDLNYTMLQAFEWYSPGGGVHWNKLKGLVPGLASMGVTAFWIPPPTKAAGGDNSTGYDSYDLWDLGEFDQKNFRHTKYGTKEELDTLVKSAHEQGIVSYVDTVLNHKFGADFTETFAAIEMNPDDRLQDMGQKHDIEGWTAFDFAGRAGKYSSFKWRYDDFTGVDHDNRTGQNAIFRIWGKSWSTRVDTERRNYDFLMGADVDPTMPEVQADLFDWGAWMIDTIGATGYRFDAVKHIDYRFISDFIKSARSRTQKPALFAVGEFWKDSIEDINNYLDDLGTQFSVFDVPLHYNFKQASDSWNRFDMRRIFDGTVVQSRPIDAVTLVDNHDTQIGQSLQSWVQPWFKPLAYALILLRGAGYPCVFYGDLYGCGGDNPQQPMSQLADFIRARKLFAYGTTWDAWDHPNCIGWVRSGDKDHDGCAVVLCNGSEGVKRMPVGKEHVGEPWTDLLKWHPAEVVIDQDGWGEFRCQAGSVSIWTRKDARGREEF